jgi:hypothetical protein
MRRRYQQISKDCRPTAVPVSFGGDRLSKSESRSTWVIVFALILFAGVASAAWPFIADLIGGDSGQESATAEIEAENTVIVIDIQELPLSDAFVLLPFDTENVGDILLSQVEVLAIATGIALISVGGLGLLIALVTWLLSKQITAVATDEDYQAAQAELDKRAKAELEAVNQDQSLNEPHPERSERWSTISTSIVILIFVWIAGLVLGLSLFGDATYEINGREVNPVAIINGVLILITIVVLVLTARARKPGALDAPENDNAPVNWGYVWILLSGLIIVGIGTGLAIALRSGAAG